MDKLLIIKSPLYPMVREVKLHKCLIFVFCEVSSLIVFLSVLRHFLDFPFILIPIFIISVIFSSCSYMRSLSLREIKSVLNLVLLKFVLLIIFAVIYYVGIVSLDVYGRDSTILGIIWSSMTLTLILVKVKEK